MQIDNPFQMNDWGIGKFLKIILAVQLAMLGVIGLDAIGLQIPIIRQLVGFIYLTFVPGIIIIRILKLHKLGSIETVLYAAGLSISTLMSTGLFMNAVYPLFGISEPISITSLVITLSMLVLMLCVLSYMRDKYFVDLNFIEFGDILSLQALFLCLIPFLAIFGACLVNFYDNNMLLLTLLILLSILPIFIISNRFPKNLYPLAVFIIAVSLLYHKSLISMHLTGWDIQFEYYLSNSVKINGIWDSTIPNAYNGMLTIVMLAPIFSKVCGMSIVWVFKIIYPLLFSLVPLGLYQVFQKQTNDTIAFLSVFFFISLSTFYGEMLALARQQIAELFLILLMLLMIDKTMDRMKRAGLLIIFAFSLAVSHYGLSYIFMFSLIAVCGMFFLNIWRKHQDNMAKVISTPRFVALYITFAIAWYIYVSSSSTFVAIVQIGDHIVSSIYTEFLDPAAAEGIARILEETLSPLHSVTKYLHLLSQFFIAMGILTILLKRKETEFEKEYAVFSYVNFMICFAAIGVPYFASALNMTRLYQITLIFLAPFCVIGGTTVFKMLSRVLGVVWTGKSARSSLNVLSIFLMVFLLFNSGFVYEIAKDHPMSISLNNSIDAPRYNQQEVVGVQWLLNVRNDKLAVYSDQCEWLLLNGMISFDKAIRCDADTEKISINAYIYLRSLIVKEGKIAVMEKKSRKYYVNLQNSTFFNEVLIHRNKIYNNGGSEIYR